MINHGDAQPIRHNHPPALESHQIKKLTDLANENHFHLGARELSYKLGSSDEPNIQVKVHPSNIRKYLKKEKLRYTRLKIIKRPHYKNRETQLDDIGDLAH